MESTTQTVVLRSEDYSGVSGQECGTSEVEGQVYVATSVTCQGCGGPLPIDYRMEDGSLASEVQTHGCGHDFDAQSVHDLNERINGVY